MEWFGGRLPRSRDVLVGDINSFGFKDVYYNASRTRGRVWVDDFWLSKTRATDKITQKCR